MHVCVTTWLTFILDKGFYNSWPHSIPVNCVRIINKYHSTRDNTKVSCELSLLASYRCFWKYAPILHGMLSDSSWMCPNSNGNFKLESLSTLLFPAHFSVFDKSVNQKVLNKLLPQYLQLCEVLLELSVQRHSLEMRSKLPMFSNEIRSHRLQCHWLVYVRE